MMHTHLFACVMSFLTKINSSPLSFGLLLGESKHVNEGVSQWIFSQHVLGKCSGKRLF